MSLGPGGEHRGRVAGILEVVDIDQARLIFEAASHPKSFLSLDDADHLLTDHNSKQQTYRCSIFFYTNIKPISTPNNIRSDKHTFRFPERRPNG